MFDGPATWQARLALQFRSAHGRTVCSHRHVGPLRLQKPLYPEGHRCCHAIVIHPPAGIAGGDALEIDVAVEPGAHALLTTPGAAKWYKANGRGSSQQVRLTVEGVLEWLPQEAIVFDTAVVRSSIDIELGETAAMIGWDIVALGRRAAGERYTQGCFAQSIRLCRQGRLLWHERTRLLGSDGLLDSPAGLGGHVVFGCLWAAGPAVELLDLDLLRDELGREAAPVTRPAPSLLVARTLADGTGAARAALGRVWEALRPRLCGLPARPPRLWST